MGKTVYVKWWAGIYKGENGGKKRKGEGLTIGVPMFNFSYTLTTVQKRR